MRGLSFALGIVLALLPNKVSCHGHIKSVILNSKTYTAFLPTGTPDYNADAPSIVRKIGSEGPVTDIGTRNLTCNINAVPIRNTDGTSRVGEITAGTNITFAWSGFTHNGAVLTYAARCSPDCGSFIGTEGAVWFKLDEIGYRNGTGWATLILHDQGFLWQTTIPECLEDGEYLLRHEIIYPSGDLGRTQFYPTCTQIKVVGGLGTKTPDEAEMIAFPGGYKKDAPGILWNSNLNAPSTYTTPGPPVFKC